MRQIVAAQEGLYFILLVAKCVCISSINFVDSSCTKETQTFRLKAVFRKIQTRILNPFFCVGIFVFISLLFP
jgi:hypothetical protein